MIVRLSWSEVFRCALSAVAARIRSIRRRDTPQGASPPAWGIAIENACAELALAKAIGRRPLPGTIVRSTWRQAGRLIIHEHDHDGGTYVLVTGSVPCYRVVGWIRGVDAKTDRFWAPGDGRGGYFVPQSELHPLGAG